MYFVYFAISLTVSGFRLGNWLPMTRLCQNSQSQYLQIAGTVLMPLLLMNCLPHFMEERGTFFLCKETSCLR